MLILHHSPQLTARRWIALMVVFTALAGLGLFG